MKLHRQRFESIGGYIQEHKGKTAGFLLGGSSLIIILIQVVYPWNTLPPSAAVGGVAVGGMSTEKATKKLNEHYASLPLQLFFGESNEPYRQPRPADIGLTINSVPQVKSQEYAWWWRFVPTSLWWVHRVNDSAVKSQYQRDVSVTEKYILDQFGKSCQVTPKNATITYKDKKLQVVEAIDGGNCKFEQVKELLTSFEPTSNDTDIRIAIDPRPASITDGTAVQFAKDLRERTVSGLGIVVANQTVPVDQQTLLSWLDFQAPDSGLVATVNPKRSAAFFEKQLAPKVAKTAGTSYVTTRDFTVISERRGAPGQQLDAGGTRTVIEQWLAGQQATVTAQVSAVPPKVVYTRTYSPTDTGITALITQFAQSRPGVYGVSFIELDGQHRRAAYQDTKLFRTASTYKLFIAYSTLRRIDSGEWKWSDQIQGGRDLAKCFDDMIVRSDNPCAETLLQKIGFQAITNEIHAIGLTRSSFLHDFIETTAGDLTTFVGALQTKQLPLSDSSRNTLLSAMERNIYRQGIPAGAKGTVADKVGFLEDYLHDVAVVYSPNGTYALTILTKGSSWGAIAELTRQIEVLRAK